MTPLELLATAARALLVSAYLPVFKLEDSPLVRALGTSTRGWVIGVPVGSWHVLPLQAGSPTGNCNDRNRTETHRSWEAP